MLDDETAMDLARAVLRLPPTSAETTLAESRLADHLLSYTAGGHVRYAMPAWRPAHRKRQTAINAWLSYAAPTVADTHPHRRTDAR